MTGGHIHQGRLTYEYHKNESYGVLGATLLGELPRIPG